jgi:thioredoxin 1
MTALHIDANQFQKEVLDYNGIVVVDFYAEWCGPCKMMGPAIDELSEDSKIAKFVKIDVDKNQDLAGQFNIFSIPTLVFFKNGQPVHQLSGMQAKEAILAEVEKL